MGHWIIGQKLAEEIVTGSTGAEFEDNEDFHRRVAKLADLEEWGRRNGSLVWNAFVWFRRSLSPTIWRIREPWNSAVAGRHGGTGSHDRGH